MIFEKKPVAAFLHHCKDDSRQDFHLKQHLTCTELNLRFTPHSGACVLSFMSAIDYLVFKYSLKSICLLIVYFYQHDCCKCAETKPNII